MDEATPDHLRAGTPSLASAVRRARVEDAERSDAVAELRGAEMARLDMLHEAIVPVLAQVPAHIDLFDAGLVPGERPRLFIDMIGFVEMGADRRTYRFQQDTRHGRITLAESDKLHTMTAAVAGYVARRLVEREKALAADGTSESAAGQHLGERAADARFGQTPGTVATPPPFGPAPPARPRRFGRVLTAVLIHLVEYLGVLVLLGLLGAGVYQVYRVVHPWLLARHGVPAP